MVVRSELCKKMRDLHFNILASDMEKVISIILAEIIAAIKSNEFGSVELRNFGRFSLRIQNARLGRNPATGTPLNIPMKKKIHFKPSSVLLKRLNEN